MCDANLSNSLEFVLSKPLDTANSLCVLKRTFWHGKLKKKKNLYLICLVFNGQTLLGGQFVVFIVALSETRKEKKKSIFFFSFVVFFFSFFVVKEDL